MSHVTGSVDLCRGALPQLPPVDDSPNEGRKPNTMTVGDISKRKLHMVSAMADRDALAAVHNMTNPCRQNAVHVKWPLVRTAMLLGNSIAKERQGPINGLTF